MRQPTPRSRLGRYETTAVGGETVRAFLPPPLPPVPPVDLTGLQLPLERAQMALGRLDGMASILPDTGLFLYMYVRKEALLSSQIEGTQSSLSDLLLFETDEVSCYVAALYRGLELLRGGLPAARRIIKAWRTDYNTTRPHTSLNGLTSAAFATRPASGQMENRLCS